MSRLAEDFKVLGRVEGAPSTFGMSFGLSTHPEDEGTVRRMVKTADDRLILSKKSKVGLQLAGGSWAITRSKAAGPWFRCKIKNELRRRTLNSATREYFGGDGVSDGC